MSTAKLGIDFAFPTIMLTLVSYGLLCEPELMTISEDETSEPLPTNPVTQHGGHPISKEYVQPSTSTTASKSSSGTETETEQLMEAPEREYKMPTVGGVAKERTCPICEDVISSSLTLIKHIKAHHPDSRLYFYEECENSFNTVADLHSHVSIIHCEPSVHCKFCDYTTMTQSRMHQHVHLHAKGEFCDVCGKSYPTLSALLLHKYLHLKCVDIPCSACNAVFKSKVLLVTHVKGKHGDGYCCPCGVQFDSPIQCKRHQKKCDQL